AGGGVDDLAVFEGQLHAVALAAVVDGGEAEVDLTIHTIDDRSGEDFAVGEILVPVAVDPGMSGERERHVRAVGGDDVVVALAVEIVDQPLLPLADLLPR